jgi:DNA-binding NarL/FixJ family response regulator
MVNPISSNSAALNGNIAAEQARLESAEKPEAAPAQAIVAKADVVELSNSAQAKLLKQEGLNVSEIAIKLGLDVKTVSSYLPTVVIKSTE